MTDVPTPLEAEAIEDRDLRDLFLYWRSKWHGGLLPGRADIDPAEIPRLLPFVALIDVMHRPLDFRVRLVGTDIVRRFGEELTGRRLAEIDLDDHYALIFDEYRSAVETREPSLHRQEFVRDDGRFMSYWRILLPLAADGTHVDMVLTGQKATTGNGLAARLRRL